MYKILVVDDSKTMQKIIKKYTKEFAVCTEASNGKEAFDIYNKALDIKENFDLIILDVEMPIMNGIMFLKLVREYEEFLKLDVTERVPVFFITANNDREEEAINLECEHVFIKPIDPKDLLVKIAHYLPKIVK